MNILHETLGEKQKCDFETCVLKYIKGHKLVKHTRGQYQCQRGGGCKATYKTVGELDEHLKNMHNQDKSKEVPIFKCESCDQTFNEKFKFRVHIQRQHANISYQCENFNKVFNTERSMYAHMNECTVGFETVNSRPCRYFLNGFCLKGSSCTFSHQPSFSAPFCRNGQR